ncbi:hypothetical protein DICPUDRAFT_42718, partial [Dictyostelium purpureum]
MENLKREEKEMNENLYQFQQQPQLAIKEGLEIGELLFWKVFRNKFLFNKIFS